MAPDPSTSSKEIFGFNRYQWMVLFAAWLGWGFDIFDAILFNFVSRLCIPDLLGAEAGDPQNVTRWTGLLTSLLLVGWAIGGIVFGKITDKIGRSKTLLITMLTYACATAACAFASNIWMFAIFRFIGSLGIGGEWAAGAALVAETVPEKKRVQAGTLLYTAAPAGLFLAIFVTDFFTRSFESIASDPSLSWRAVFLTGLIPAAVAFVIRLYVKEPEGFTPQSQVQLRELFTPKLLPATISGLSMATIALITWWSCNAFLPTVSSFLASDVNPASSAASLSVLKAEFVTKATTVFNIGGLIGTLLTAPLAILLGRRKMFLIFFIGSALSIWLVMGGDLSPYTRIYSTFFIGLTVFGVFGSFTFYLPELFPARVRGTGAGFCYNTGRIITALGPFIVGEVSRKAQSSGEILTILSWVALVPLLGAILVLVGVCKEPEDVGI